MEYSKLLAICSLIFFFSNNTKAQTDIYWVGGNGDWGDISMWYKDAAGTSPAGIIPNANSIVHFTDQSSTIPIWNVRFQPGSYDVHSIFVETADDFRIKLNGTDNNEVEVSVYGDISFLPSHTLEYESTFLQNNKWKFVGTSNHDIQTGGQDLFNIEIHEEGFVFHQLDDLLASAQIRMFSGVWNSNGHDVTSSKILFEDDEPSNAPLTKVFNSGSSTILCDEWESGFTYGSLDVTGNHTIRTRRFRGSPKQINDPPFSFHEIHLLEYDDASQGTPIEYNNFECRECIIESIVIEDTGDTKLADEFTVTGKFTVVNLGSSILFNGGNGRDSEITFNGLIITPKVIDCDDPLTIFSSIHTDESIFKRASGTLEIKDAVVNNIETETSNGAIFNLDKGLLQGASSGWNITSLPNSITYYWKGIAGGVGDWDDPDNWTLENGQSNGCIPKIIDDVFVDGNAKGDIRIPRPYNAVCKNFIWTNKDGLELTLDGSNALESSLTVTGNFDLEQSAIITPVSFHEIYFSSSTNNYIQTNGVHLPELLFIGNSGEWTLEDDLTCDKLTFEAGTFNSNGQDIVTDIWNAFEEYPKYFNFSSSHIKVNGIMDLAEFVTRNVTIDPGTSLIECEVLNCIIPELYNVRLINTNPITLGNTPYVFNSLILKGTGQVTTQNDLTLKNLIFKEENSILALNSSYELTLTNGILSQTSTNNPGILKSSSSGTQAIVTKSGGNICTIGPVQFIDIDVNMSYVFNAPDGIDGGNNSDIDFTDGNDQSTNIYWIGGTGDWTVKSNWSGISGGCPADKNPNLYPNVIIDSGGIFSDEIIKVSGLNECGHLFITSSNNVTLDIVSQLSPTALTVDGGYATMIGKYMVVDGGTTVSSSGFLESNLLTFSTQTVLTLSGVVIVREGSNFAISQ